MITVLGASGFVGSNLILDLKRRNVKYFAPSRDESLIGLNLGDIIYCIGLTSDAKYRPHETIVAHISKLQEIIQYSFFNSITYCSSTRVYIHNFSTHENSNINVNVNEDFELFNLTKLTAESLLKNTVKNFKIVRLSNVFGDDFISDNFLTSISRDAILNQKITLRTTPKSSKDYIYIKDVVNMLIDIAQSNLNGIFNVAFGKNFTNESILNEIHALTGAKIEYSQHPADIVFTEINIKRIKEEINYEPTYSIIDFLPGFIFKFKNLLIK